MLTVGTLSRARTALIALLVLAGIGFALGVMIERSSGEETGGEGTHSEAGEAPGANQESNGEGASESEKILGIKTESTALLVIAFVVSGLLVAAVLLLSRSRPAMVTVGVVAFAFALFDLLEVAHQLDHSRAGLTMLAAFVGVAHVAATGMAYVVAREPEPPSQTS